MSKAAPPVLVIGAGLAGLIAAIAAEPKRMTEDAAGRLPERVIVLSAGILGQDCSSAWAQGGIAAALSEGDDPAQHAQDTVAAGAGLVDAQMAALLTTEGPDAVRALAALGAPFDRDSQGGFAQSLEAAHSRPRVARVKGDQAGREILRAVIAKALSCPWIEVRQNARVRALLKDANGQVRGALVEQDGQVRPLLASAVIMAAGGLGGLYAVTTNPRQIRGEAMALAALAGAKIADPEFVQFHPTAIDIDLDPAPLATEALRGEGARLIDAEGRAFMLDHHPKGDLAPRDIVARAIHAQRVGGNGAFLDARQAVGEAFPHEFPTVFAACLGGGLDPRSQPIPIAPAAHYHMGGIWTDADGRTSLAGLYAVGECAATGVHGANRLASNSLLEACVFGARAGRSAAQEVDPNTQPLATKAAPDLSDEAMQTLRKAMDLYAGVVRDDTGLKKLLAVIDRLQDQHGLALPLVAARLVATSALERLESRGSHSRSDYPDTMPKPLHTLTSWEAVVSRRPIPAAAQ